jgi:ankyrin repeat protein
MNLSQNIDIDREILLHLNEEDFRKFFMLNKYFHEKIFKSHYLIKRLQKLYDYFIKRETELYSIKKYKQYYNLLKKGSDDLIYEAANIGDLNLIEHALGKGADINTYKYYYPPLVNAVRNNHFDIVKYLIENGASVNNHPEKYFCIDVAGDAANNGHLHILKYLMEEKQAKISNRIFIKPCEKGHLFIVKYLVKYLLEKKIDMQARVKDALQEAAKNGHLNVVKYLLKREADINENRKNFPSALVYACRNNHIAVIKYLIDQGADIHANNDLSLLWSIEYSNDIITVKYLVEHGSIVNSEHLKKACEKGNLEIVGYLVERGAVINQKCIEYAGYSGNLDVVKYLVEKGQNIKSNNYEALKYVCCAGHKHLIQYFVESGTDINKDYYAFKNCIKRKHIEAIKYLIQAGISQNFKNRGLITAAKHGYFPIVKLLVEYGANVHFSDDKAIGLANSLYYEDIAHYLNKIE